MEKAHGTDQERDEKRMVLTEYFFDSYALIELGKSNPAYLKYADCFISITQFNLIKVMYSAFQEWGEDKAKETYSKFKDCVVEVNQEVILEALRLKQKYKRRNLSYADCIGYALAKSKSIPFLTGDKEFENLENVEFVK